MKTYHLIVHGSVQGVGFRFYTKRQAQKLGVTGWVKNKADGTVEIAAQSDSATLKKFIAAVKAGSPASRVERVDIKEIQGAKRYKVFQVKYD